MSECGHDGWVFGCPICAVEERAALEAMGEVVVTDLERDDDERPVPLDEEEHDGRDD